MTTAPIAADEIAQHIDFSASDAAANMTGSSIASGGDWTKMLA